MVISILMFFRIVNVVINCVNKQKKHDVFFGDWLSLAAVRV